MLHRRPAFLVAVAVALGAGFAFLIWTMSARSREAPVEVAPGSVAAVHESPKAQPLVQPSASEPALAPPAPAPEVRTPTAAAGAQAAAITLKVAVVDEQGAAITSGELECAWGRKGFRVTDVGGRMRVPIAAESTLIKLPMSAMEALVVARDSSHAPAQVRVEELRRKNGKMSGKWIADDESFTRDVRIVLPSSGPPTNGIWGTIFVDDVPRTPAGLTILAEMSYESMVAAIPENEPSKIPMHREPVTAVIDPDRNEYRLASLEKGAWGIGVKSEETVATWCNAKVESSSLALRVDLHLTTGASVVLHARDALTRAAVPGIAIRLDYQLAISDHGEWIHLESTADATGACMFRGLPREVSLKFRERKSSESSPALLELTLKGTDPRELHHDLWVNGPDPTMCTCWGYLPESIAAREFSEDAPLTLGARNLEGVGGMKYGSFTDSKWSVVLAPNARVELWMSSKGERLTARRQIKTQVGMQGPIELVPVQLVPLRLAWTNAPIGCKLELQGVPGSYGMVLAEREGSLELQRLSDNGVSVKVNGLDGGFLSMSYPESVLGDELKVDLAGDRQLSVEVRVNGAVPEGSETLQLVAFDPPAGAAYAFASLPIRSGKSAAVPLPRGPHFFSMVAKSGGETPSTAVVTGIVDLGSGAAPTDATVKIDWRGQSLSSAEWSALGRSGFMVTRCGERDLLPVKEVWRRYRFKDLELSPGGSTLLFDRANCRTVAWDD